MDLKSLCSIGVVLGYISILSSVQAGIVIAGTRVIYPSDQKTITVQVKNEGAQPVLMQTWIDDGDATRTPDELDVPFIIMPPMSRLDAQTGQSINISYIPTNMAQDRESIYWLNVLDIPSKYEQKENEEVAAAILQVAVRSRIKLFYRPSNLKETALDAPNHLQWIRVGKSLQVKNPTPYYVNISSLEVDVNPDKTLEFLSDGLMLAPFEDKKIDIEGFDYTKFKVLSINDFGGVFPVEVKLNH